jgi:hypothetical protein
LDNNSKIHDLLKAVNYAQLILGFGKENIYLSIKCAMARLRSMKPLSGLYNKEIVTTIIKGTISIPQVEKHQIIK